MSRAMNVKLAEADVTARCKSAGVSISAIETLPGGGTHLVCRTSEGADQMRGLMAKQMIAGRVKRFAYFNIPPRY